MNTIENNILLGNFVGFKSTNNVIRAENGKYYDFHAHPKFSCIQEQEIQIESENGYGLVEQDFLFAEDLKFHSDWNWLMEVVEKIESLGLNYVIGIMPNYVYIDTLPEIIFKKGTRIENLYNACLEFIKWYNEQNK